MGRRRHRFWNHCVYSVIAALILIALMLTSLHLNIESKDPILQNDSILDFENSDEDFDKYNASWFAVHPEGHPHDSIRIHYYNKQVWLKTTVFDKCKYKCHMTWGRQRYKDADFVIFFGPRLNKSDAPPKPTGQTWIYHSKECIANYNPLENSWKFKFNWTMTTRRDSDSTAYNGFMRMVESEYNTDKLKELWETKDREAAWFVSNCDGHSKRKEFVQVLSKYINIDIYGSCGKYHCSRSNESVCFNMLKKRYKLYIAFENSLCFDYVTEKGYNIYVHVLDVIPVVRGVGNSQYSMFFPPGSYISTDDFTSIKQLGKYLKTIMKDFDKFSKYMWWKQFYQGYFSFPLEFCNICERAHKKHKYRRLYSDLNEFEKGNGYKNFCNDAKDITE